MNELITGDGYIVVEKLIPDTLIDSILAKQDTLHPVRASSNTKKYAEREDIKNLPNIFFINYTTSYCIWINIIIIF